MTPHFNLIIFQSTIAKKPYNPIIGETFHCMWHVHESSDGVTKPSCHHLYFSAEQVSHHPPITAFHLECPSKGIRLSASIHTKSKFQGMYITAQMVGKGLSSLSNNNIKINKHQDIIIIITTSLLPAARSRLFFFVIVLNGYQI